MFLPTYYIYELIYKGYYWDGRREIGDKRQKKSIIIDSNIIF